MRIAIAGAGIAGLTAAIALARCGFSVDLFERAPELEEIGAGIQLSPNAMAVLEQLGVAGDLAGVLCEPEAIDIRDARTGALLTTLPLGAAARSRYGAPYCLVHRADLHTVLLAAARRSDGVALHLGAEVHDVRGTGAGVTFAAGGGSRLADVLVAADGVRSRIRTAWFRHPGARSLGHTAWRAALPSAGAPDATYGDRTVLWLAAGAHMVHYPVRAGSTLNIVVIAAGDSVKPAPPVDRFGAHARRVIEAVPRWTLWPLAEVDAARHWVNGRVGLIGDSAHGMAPSAAQGGAQAIEDAWVLAESLARTPSDPALALAAYERIRRPRALRVSRAAKRNMTQYEIQGVAATARNSMLGILPARLFFSQLDWLFGWKPE